MAQQEGQKQLHDIARSINQRIDAIKSKEAQLDDRERRVAYREEMVSKRERIIYGKSNA